MFSEIDQIEKGAYGSVYRGYYVPIQDNFEEKPVAIKIQNVPKRITDNVTQESQQNIDAVLGDIVSLRLLKHPNIVRLLDVKRINSKIYMIMEYCNQKDLDDFIRKKI